MNFFDEDTMSLSTSVEPPIKPLLMTHAEVKALFDLPFMDLYSCFRLFIVENFHAK